MYYTVKYKKVGDLFWRKIAKVKGDGFVENASIRGETLGPNYSARWFILADESRVEIPCTDVMFKFSRDRFLLIQENMSKEAGRPVQ